MLGDVGDRVGDGNVGDRDLTAAPFDDLLNRSTGADRAAAGTRLVDRLLAAAADRLPVAAPTVRFALGRSWWLPVLVAVGALAVAAAALRFGPTPAVDLPSAAAATATRTAAATSPSPTARGPGSSPDPAGGSSAISASTRAATPRSTSGTSSPTAEPAIVVVDVVGRVRRAGVVRLAPGARVGDAVTAAGGVAPGTDVSALNMARPVSDGQQIRVGLGSPWLVDPGSGTAGTAEAAGSGPGGAGGPAGTAPPAGTASASTAAPGAPVDLNTATLQQLDGLPGVGPVTAQKILDWRSQHGRFTSVDDLDEIPGIGPARLADLRPLVRAS